MNEELPSTDRSLISVILKKNTTGVILGKMDCCSLSAKASKHQSSCIQRHLVGHMGHIRFMWTCHAAIVVVALEPRPDPAPGNWANQQHLSASTHTGYLHLTQVGTTYMARQHEVQSLTIGVVRGLRWLLLLLKSGILGCTLIWF